MQTDRSPCVDVYPTNWQPPSTAHLLVVIGVIRDRTLHRIPSSFILHTKARCDWLNCSLPYQVANQSAVMHGVVRLIKVQYRCTLDHRSRGMSVIFPFFRRCTPASVNFLGTWIPQRINLLGAGVSHPRSCTSR